MLFKRHDPPPADWATRQKLMRMDADALQHLVDNHLVVVDPSDVGTLGTMYREAKRQRKG